MSDVQHSDLLTVAVFTLIYSLESGSDLHETLQCSRRHTVAVKLVKYCPIGNSVHYKGM